MGALFRAALPSASALLVALATATLLPGAGVAQAAKVAVCHKPGAKQKIVRVEPQDVALHESHGDYVVTAEACNGVDDDCDGAADDGIAAIPTSCGVGECAGNEGEQTCVAGGLVDSCDPFAGATSEVCTGGLDEDCDGFIDCVDSDCDAEPTCMCPCWDLDDFASVTVSECQLQQPVGLSFPTIARLTCGSRAFTVLDLSASQCVIEEGTACPFPFNTFASPFITNIQRENCDRILRQAAADDGVTCTEPP